MARYSHADGAEAYADARERQAARASQSFMEDWLTAPQVADFAGVALQTIIIARQHGELRFHEIDGTMRTDPEGVRRWAREKRLRFA